MDVPNDLAKRMAAAGWDSIQVSELQRRGVSQQFLSHLERMVSRREKAEALFKEWCPRLREFAASCRSKDSRPDPKILSLSDYAKLAIYEQMITRAERVGPNHSILNICRIPLIGVPVAQRLWPGEDPAAVVVTPEEFGNWSHSIYKHSRDADNWWNNYQWSIDDAPDPNSDFYKHFDLTVPDGESPWLVTSTLVWPPNGGGAVTQLWSWNGATAKYIRFLYETVC